MRIRLHLAVASLLVFLCLPCFASTVGNCKSDKHSYQTIMAAIAATPDDGVVEVCPGTYLEQLYIERPLSIRGIGTFTVAPPAGGLRSLADIGKGTSGDFAQVFIDSPKGQVTISYMATASGMLAFPAGNPVSTVALCQDGILGSVSGSYTGIYSVSGEVTLDHVQTGIDIDPVPPGTLDRSVRSANCGNGVIFAAGEGVVKDSVISFGHYGIRGAAKVDHTTVSGGGPSSVGIDALEVMDSTASGPGFFYTNSIGVKARIAVGNVVQAWTTGVQGDTVRRNTLLNNEVGISGAGDLTDNLVVGPSTFPNPACPVGVLCSDQNPASNVPSNLPTVGVELACADGTVTLSNNLVGVGIAFANMDMSRKVPPSNLLANVPISSTNCSQ